jgi:hypothetical protein
MIFFQDLVTLAREKSIKRCIADLIALPMLPVHLIRQRFDFISQQLHLENKLFDPFISYFRKTYIRSRTYPIVAWNHYNHLGTRPRTNNHVEGNHRQLKK